MQCFEWVLGSNVSVVGAPGSINVALYDRSEFEAPTQLA